MILAAGELRHPSGHEYLWLADLPVWTLAHYAGGNMRSWTGIGAEAANMAHCTHEPQTQGPAPQHRDTRDGAAGSPGS